MGQSPWQPPANRLPGSYGHHWLLQHLGHGGQGVVWLAESDRQPGELRAIKFFRDPPWGASPALVEAFLSEALFGIGLRSHHLGHTLELLDLRPWTADGWPPVAMVMEYYGCSLEQILRECNGSFKFPASRVARWARQLVTALEELHDRYGRVHRDVKPGNIMFRLPPGRRYEGPPSLVDAEALLTDFGTTALAGAKSPLIVYRDHWKDPRLYPEVGSFEAGDLADVPPASGPAANPDSTVEHWQPLDALPHQHCVTAMDVYSFGLVLRELASITEGDTRWLLDVAADCTHDDPASRPRAAELFLRLAPDWDEQLRLLREGGWDPGKHWGFVGRRFLIDGAFPEFVRACGERGGVFALVAPAGVGKTALLNKWCEEVGQPFGFFFRYNERDNPATMPEKIAEQLRRQFELADMAKKPADDWASYLESLCRAVAGSPRFRPPLLIFIDGLDEATDPARAVGFLPKRDLPHGVYVIVSTRPHAKGEDHVGKLRSAGAHIAQLAADDPDNLADLERYLFEQIGTAGTPEQLHALARNAGGIFLLARLLVEAIREGQLSVAEALVQSGGWARLDPSQRLFAYYGESWKRACANEDEVRLADLAQLLAAVFGWVSEDQVGRILNWYEREVLRRAERYWSWGRVRAVLKSLNWFLDRREGDRLGEFSYQVRHQSVRDYLLSADGPVSPAGLNETHGAIGRFYCEAAERDGWPRVDPYGRFHAVRHLLQAGDRRHAELAARLLADLDYLLGTLGDVPPTEERRRPHDEGGAP